jgi:hypothetical protein
VENDFIRARRRQVLARLAHRLRREPDCVNLILPFGEVVAALGMQGERQLGLKTLQLDSVVGSDRRLPDRRPAFRPGRPLPGVDRHRDRAEDHRGLRDLCNHLNSGRRHPPPRRPADKELRADLPGPRPAAAGRPGRHRLMRTHEWSDHIIERLRAEIG